MIYLVVCLLTVHARVDKYPLSLTIAVVTRWIYTSNFALVRDAAVPLAEREHEVITARLAALRLEDEKEVSNQLCSSQN